MSSKGGKTFIIDEDSRSDSGAANIILDTMSVGRFLTKTDRKRDPTRCHVPTLSLKPEFLPPKYN